MLKNKKSAIYKNKLLKIILTTVLAVGLSTTFIGCRSSKSIISNDGSVANKSKEQLLEDVLNAELDYSTVSGKISLEFISGDKLSGMKVNAYLKIIKDNIIQLSVRAPFINVEVFRADITPDSIYITDRLSKRYAYDSFENLKKGKDISINYYNIQSLFTNAIFIAGKRQINKNDYDDFTTSLTNNKYKMEVKKKSDFLYDFVIDSNDRIIETKLSGMKNQDFSLIWTYDDFIKDEKFVYPSKMKAKMNVKKKPITLSISYSKLDINKELNVDKSLSAKYQQTSILGIIQNYLK